MPERSNQFGIGTPCHARIRKDLFHAKGAKDAKVRKRQRDEKPLFFSTLRPSRPLREEIGFLCGLRCPLGAHGCSCAEASSFAEATEDKKEDGMRRPATEGEDRAANVPAEASAKEGPLPAVGVSNPKIGAHGSSFAKATEDRVTRPTKLALPISVS
jgi:hypothetical protein